MIIKISNDYVDSDSNNLEEGTSTTRTTNTSNTSTPRTRTWRWGGGFKSMLVIILIFLLVVLQVISEMSMTKTTTTSLSSIWNTISQQILETTTTTTSSSSWSSPLQSLLLDTTCEEDLPLPTEDDSYGGGEEEESIRFWDSTFRQELMEEIMNSTKRNKDNQPCIRPRYVLVGEEEIKSRILSTGQLVVPVNHQYAFWYEGNTRLCHLLRNMTLILDEGISLSDTSSTTSTIHPSILLPTPILNMTVDAEPLSKDQNFGQGNWITAIYAARISVAYAKIEFHFQTEQTNNGTWYESSLLPWFRFIQPAPTIENPWPYDGGMPPVTEDICPGYRELRIDRMAHEIQSNLRAMAWQIVDPPRFLLDGQISPPTIPFPAPSFSRIPNITLDDVALHFRCGDIMGGARRNDFGIIKFTEYPKWIFPNTTTIGILTQPFEKHLNRGIDSHKTEDCRKAVYVLVDYLQGKYPNATITIRNSEEETLPLTFARLVMARQAFTSLSSFGIFPVIGTYGDGYFQKGNRGVNPFSSYIPQYLTNLHEMQAPYLGSWTILKMGLNDTLAWFVDETDGRRWRRRRRMLVEGKQTNHFWEGTTRKSSAIRVWEPLKKIWFDQLRDNFRVPRELRSTTKN